MRSHNAGPFDDIERLGQAPVVDFTAMIMS